MSFKIVDNGKIRLTLFVRNAPTDMQKALLPNLFVVPPSRVSDGARKGVSGVMFGIGWWHYSTGITCMWKANHD